MIDQCPVQRFGQPEHIATIALFLASDIHHLDCQIIKIDGGFEI